MPVTIPVLLPIVAIVVLLLAHVPPGVASLKIVVCPTHTVGMPVIALGPGTVTVVVIKHPPGMIYEIIDVPLNMPVTTPVLLPIVAMVVLLLVQVPPGVASLSDIVAPMHTVIVPAIGSGNGSTVNVIVI